MMDKKKLINELSKFKTNESRAVWMLSQVDKIQERFEEANFILEDKVYKFVNDFLNNETDLSKDLKKYIAIGKRYSNFIDIFKSRVWYEEIEEASRDKSIELLKMAKAEIQKLRSNISATKQHTNEMQRDIRTMERKLYCHSEIEKLPEVLKKKAISLTEGISSKYKIDNIIREIKNAKQNEIRI